MKNYELYYEDFRGEHSRDPQTIVVRRQDGFKWYFHVHLYGSLQSAFRAAQNFLRARHAINYRRECQSEPHYTLDQLLGEAGTRP